MSVHDFLRQFSDLRQVSAWFSQENLVTYIYKTDRHNINEIMLKEDGKEKIPHRQKSSKI
jgi:hypothetical protein